MAVTYHIRLARPGDQATIKSLIFAERLDPSSLHWHNFIVAEEAGRIIGIGQVKPYGRHRELGSLVVIKERRQRGVGGTIIRTLTNREPGPLHLFCLAFRQPYYAGFGFEPCRLSEMPATIRLKFLLVKLVNCLLGKELVAMIRAPGCIPV